MRSIRSANFLGLLLNFPGLLPYAPPGILYSCGSSHPLGLPIVSQNSNTPVQVFEVNDTGVISQINTSFNTCTKIS